MKRGLLALLVASLVASNGPVARAGQQAWRYDTCRFARYDGNGGFSTAEVILTIRCAARHFPVDVSKALSVAWCESRYYHHAASSSGTYKGVFQLSDQEFATAYSKWRDLWRRWRVRKDIWHARSNVLLGMRKAAAYGWGGWSCQ